MSRPAERLSIDPQAPDPAVLRRAADCLKTGGVVILPTGGLYGLAADCTHLAAVARVFRLKGRPVQKPLPVLIGSMRQLERLAAAPSPLARCLMDRLWPGKVTFVVPCHGNLAPGIVGPDGRIGVRLAGFAPAAALAALLPAGVTATSANRSGRTAARRLQELDPVLAAGADLLLDAGPLPEAGPSTVVQVDETEVTMLRQGRLPADMLQQAAAWCRQHG